MPTIVPVPDAFAAARTSLRERPLRWLVTGSAGFIGSHLLEALLRLEQEVVSLDNFATGHRRNLDEVRTLVGPDAVAAPHVSRGRHRRSPRPASRPATASTSCCTGGARLGAAFDRGSAANARGQRDRVPQHARGRPRRRRLALRVRGIEFDVRRPSGAAEGRGQHRPPAVALRGDQARRRAVRGRVQPLLRDGDDRTALLQRVRGAAGSRGRLRRGDSALGGRDAVGHAGRHPRRRRDHARLLPRRERRAGQSAVPPSPRVRRPARRCTTSRSAAARR